MKIHRILCLSAAIALPQLALAKLPPNSSLGQVEGTLDFCVQVDSPSAAKYEEFKKRLVQDVPEKEVAEVRKSTEYKEAYDGISEALGKAPKDQAVKACTSLLGSKK
jgi:hypothetical protein